MVDARCSRLYIFYTRGRARLPALQLSDAAPLAGGEKTTGPPLLFPSLFLPFASYSLAPAPTDGGVSSQGKNVRSPVNRIAATIVRPVKPGAAEGNTGVPMPACAPVAESPAGRRGTVAVACEAGTDLHRRRLPWSPWPELLTSLQLAVACAKTITAVACGNYHKWHSHNLRHF